MIEKLIKKVANAQEFKMEDSLGQLVDGHESDELSEQNLDQVFAARKTTADYDAFLKYAQKRDSKRR